MFGSYTVSPNLNKRVCEEICDINRPHVFLSSFLLLLFALFDYFVYVTAEAVVLVSILVKITKDVVFLFHLFESDS